MSPSCFGIGAVSALWLSGRNCPYFRAVSASWLFRPELLSASLGSVDTYVIGYSGGTAKKRYRNLKHSKAQACICKPHFSRVGPSVAAPPLCG